MFNTVVGLVLIAHGIGHTMGLFPLFGAARSAFWTGDSWLLTPAIGEVSRWMALPIWLVASIGFILAGIGLLGFGIHPAAVRPIVLISAAASLLGVALFTNSLASTGSVVGALIVDVLVLAALLLRWPVIGSLRLS